MAVVRLASMSGPLDSETAAFLSPAVCTRGRRFLTPRRLSQLAVGFTAGGFAPSLTTGLIAADAFAGTIARSCM
jgi:hypothetical protein